MKKATRAQNPLLPPQWHIPDAEAHAMPDGKLYLYGSCDKNTGNFCSTEYYVASTADLLEWDIDGPSFDVSEAGWANGSQKRSSLSNVKTFDDLPEHIKQHLPENAQNIPLQQIIAAIEAHAEGSLPPKTLLYAPDAIEKGGKYFLYFCCSDDSEGVAVSDRPTGPFHSACRLPVEGIDPAVFIDQDGQGYYYWGQFSACGAKLEGSMTSIDERTIVNGLLTEKEHYFHEGSSVRKRGDIYYYVFADVSRGKPTCLGYATGKSPLGPFVYRGVLIDNACCDPGSWNNHGSIEEWNGQWYVFYHRSSQNSEYMRRVCAEPIFFDENGLIQEVKMTSQGPGAPFVAGEMIPAYTACEVAGGAYISAPQNEIWGVFCPKGGSATFRYFQNQTPGLKVLVNGQGKAAFELWSDGALVEKGNSGCELSVSVEAGTHEMQLVFAAEYLLQGVCFTE